MEKTRVFVAPSVAKSLAAKGTHVPVIPICKGEFRTHMHTAISEFKHNYIVSLLPVDNRNAEQKKPNYEGCRDTQKFRPRAVLSSPGKSTHVSPHCCMPHYKIVPNSYLNCTFSSSSLQY